MKNIMILLAVLYGAAYSQGILLGDFPGWVPAADTSRIAGSATTSNDSVWTKVDFDSNTHDTSKYKIVKTARGLIDTTVGVHKGKVVGDVLSDTARMNYLGSKTAGGKIIVLDSTEFRKVIVEDSIHIGNVTATDSVKAGTVVSGKKVVMLADSLRGAGLYHEILLTCPNVVLPDSSRSKKNPMGVSYDSLGLGNFGFVWVANADTVGWIGPKDFSIPHNVNTTATKDSVIFEVCGYITATADSDSARSYSFVFFDTSTALSSKWPTVADTVAMDSVTGTKIAKNLICNTVKASAVALGWSGNRRVRMFFANRPDKSNYRADNNVNLWMIRIRIPLW